MPAGAPPPADPVPGVRVDRQEQILDALGDAASRRILLMLNDAPRSAQEILGQLRLPQSTLYRRLHELQELGLIGIQRTALTADGKRVDLYRSLLEELKVELTGRELRVRPRFRDLAGERLKEMWHTVRSEVRP